MLLTEVTFSNIAPFATRQIAPPVVPAWLLEISELKNVLGVDVVLIYNAPPSDKALLSVIVQFSTSTVEIMNKSRAPPLSAVLLIHVQPITSTFSIWNM